VQAHLVSNGNTLTSICSKQPGPSEEHLKLAFLAYMLFCSQVAGDPSSEPAA